MSKQYNATPSVPQGVGEQPGRSLAPKTFTLQRVLAAAGVCAPILFALGFVMSPLQGAFARGCVELSSEVIQKLITENQIGRTAGGALLVSPQALQTLRGGNACSDDELISQLEQKMSAEPKLDTKLHGTIL